MNTSAKVSGKEKVVVIGGGISGLTAGIYALLSGFEVEIYEKNAIPGGECIGWNRKVIILITAFTGSQVQRRVQRCTMYGARPELFQMI